MTGGRPLRSLVLAVLLIAASAAPAHGIGVEGFSIRSADQRSGARSDVTVTIRLNGQSDDIRGLQLDLPNGLLGNPRATPRCPTAAVQADTCPPETVVGDITALAEGIPVAGSLSVTGTVYNEQPRGDEPARLGIVIRPPASGKLVLTAPIVVRDSGDFGLTATVDDIPRTVDIALLGRTAIDIRQLQLTLRGRVTGGRGFMVNPTGCDPREGRLLVRSYDGATREARATAPFRSTSCSTTPVAPRLGLRADPARADSPTAIEILLDQDEEVGGRAPANYRRVTVIGQSGVALNASVADGLAVCTEAQFNARSDAPAQCPAASDIGGITITTPLLGDIPGEIYFGPQLDGPVFQALLEANLGSVRVKLRAKITPAKEDGRLTVVLDDLPEVPVSRFSFRFRGGPKAVLVSARQCTPQSAQARVLPWSAVPDLSPARERVIGASVPIEPSSCGPDESRPSFGLERTSDRARAFTSVVATIARPDGTPRIRDLRVTAPEGLLPRFAGVPQCRGRAAATGACPARTRIGGVQVVIGTGPSPVSLPGTVFLGGPLNGSIASLVVVVPAKVGPVSVGTLVVRATARVRRDDARLIIEAKDIPQLQQGIPIPIRDLRVTFDRKRFVFNPSGCDARPGTLRVAGDRGAPALAGTTLAGRGCRRARFAPVIRAEVDNGGRPPRLRSRPALRVSLEQRAGETSADTVDLLLPEGILPFVRAAERTCPESLYTAGRCRPASVIGRATASTPVLDRALRGPVVLAQTGFRPPETPGLSLPQAVSQIEGQGARVDVVGRLSITPLNRLRAEFPVVPDVPLRSFALRFGGGARGALEAQRDLCARRPRPGTAVITAQDGRRVTRRVSYALPDCSRKHKVSGSLRGLTTRGGTLRLRVAKAPRGALLRRVRMRVSPLVALSARRGRVTASRGTVRVRRGLLELRLPGRGAGTVTIRARGGAVRLSSLGRRRTGGIARTLAVGVSSTATDVRRRSSSIRARLDAQVVRDRRG